MAIIGSDLALKTQFDMPSPESINRPNLHSNYPRPGLPTSHSYSHLHSYQQDPQSSPRQEKHSPYPQYAGLTRSETFPHQYPARPQTNRQSTSPVNEKNRSHRSPSVSNLSKSDNEGSEELTTKGRKRKRLAKACSACHKNKRRCDGFAPCANCEFSSRPCVYVNAQGEVIPPPRTRNPGTSKPEASRQQKVAEPRKTPTSKSTTDWPPGSSRSTPRPVDRGRTDRAVMELVDRDPELCAEMLDIFFHHMQPYGAMFHTPTFYHRLYQSLVSPILIDAMCALSVPLCANPTLLSFFPPSILPSERTLPFGNRAEDQLRRELESRKAGTKRGSPAEDIELAQALVLLSAYSSMTRGAVHSHSYMDEAISLLRSINIRGNMAGLEQETLTECRNRVSWIIAFQCICSLPRRPSALGDLDLQWLPLPASEAFWERYGRGREQNISGGVSSNDASIEIGILGHASRILLIFHEIQLVARSGSADTRQILFKLEHELKSWAMSLPPEHRFDEYTLASAAARLNSPLPSVARAAWLFTFMHCLAECGMSHLQAALGTKGERWTAQRQSQAVENIVVILETMGERGRCSPMILVPLMVVSEWHSHLRSSSRLDERLSLWWSELQRMWGLDMNTVEHLTSTGSRADVMTSPRTSIGLGLYGTTSPLRASESALSTTSSSALLTPGGSNRFPSTSTMVQPAQFDPKSRSRSNTLQSRPSLPTPSESGLTHSEGKSDFTLPPLPTFDASARGIEKAGQSYFDLPRGKDSLSISPMDLPRTSPRFDPYESVRGKTATSVQSNEERAERAGDEKGRAEDVEKFKTGPPTGIAALVTAAEEKSREESS